MEDSKWDCKRARDEGCTLSPRCLDCPLDHCKDDGVEWRNSVECKTAYVAFTMDKPSYVVANSLEISVSYVNKLRASIRADEAVARRQRDTDGNGSDAQDQE